MSNDDKRKGVWFLGPLALPGLLALVLGILVIVCLFVLMPLPKVGQDYCNTLSGDATETLAAAQQHFCVSNCYYNVTKTPDGKYPPCKDHGYTFNRTAFLSVLENVE